VLLPLQQRSSQREEPEARFTPVHAGDSLRVHKEASAERRFLRFVNPCCCKATAFLPPLFGRGAEGEVVQAVHCSPKLISIYPPCGAHICVICVICGKKPEQSEPPTLQTSACPRKKLPSKASHHPPASFLPVFTYVTTHPEHPETPGTANDPVLASNEQTVADQ